MKELLEAFPSEQACIDYLYATKWKHEPVCPYCGSIRIYHFTDGSRNKCSSCRKQFSIRTGTVFERSRIPLQKWFIAIWLVSSKHKKITSAALARQIGVTQKTAWNMLNKLRLKRRLDGNSDRS